jgi:sporulation protein YlmC with PRC-barrel domain
VIRASDLIGCDVRTESGEKLGRVHDLRAGAVTDGWQLTGLVIGRGGLVARLATGSKNAPVVAGRVVPWEAITRLEEGEITVRDEVAITP